MRNFTKFQCNKHKSSSTGKHVLASAVIFEHELGGEGKDTYKDGDYGKHDRSRENRVTK